MERNMQAGQFTFCEKGDLGMKKEWAYSGE